MKAEERMSSRFFSFRVTVVTRPMNVRDAVVKREREGDRAHSLEDEVKLQAMRREEARVSECFRDAQIVRI